MRALLLSRRHRTFYCDVCERSGDKPVARLHVPGEGNPRGIDQSIDICGGCAREMLRIVTALPRATRGRKVRR